MKDFNPELGEEICRRVTEGETLLSICKDEHMPTLAVAYEWNRGRRGAPEAYARAFATSRRDAAHSWIDEAHHIADTTAVEIEDEVAQREAEVLDATGDERRARIAGHKQRRESAEIRKMRIDIRKWSASRIHRRVYGDKVALIDETPPEQVRKHVDLSKCSTEQLESILKIAEGLPDVDGGDD